MLNVIGYTARIVFSSLAQGGGPERNGIVFILPDLNGFVFISVAGSTSSPDRFSFLETQIRIHLLKLQSQSEEEKS
jgi:hypothetical protein